MGNTMAARDWTPQVGARSLVAELGEDLAITCLTRLLVGEVRPSELTSEPWPYVLVNIGDGHAARLDTEDPSQAYWQRCWAARALAYVGDAGVAPWLVRALADDHWRVRMTAVQTIGRLEIGGLEPEVAPLLDDPHARVRDAAALALGRLTRAALPGRERPGP